MSKCISVHGEYSEHEYTGENPACDYCGQVSEMIAYDQLQAMRAALEAIQELHRPVPIYTTEAGECEHGDECDPIELNEGAFCPTHTEGVTCSECAEVVQDYGVVDEFPSYPCATRRLADDALGGGQDG